MQTNRHNARASTGPRTAGGKARAAQNAHRHGLSLPVLVEPVLSKEVEALAQMIAGANASTELRNLARRVAEAQVDLVRVRQVRHERLTRNLNNPDYRPRTPNKITIRTFNEMIKLIDKELPIPEEMMDFISAIPEGPTKHATILCNLTKELVGLDRYERRAFSRRKFAIRAFDAIPSSPGSKAKK